MDNIEARLLSTQLKDRTVWFDGDSSFNPHHLLDLVRRYNVQYVDYVTDTVIDYNRVAPKDQELHVKETCNPIQFEWTIPDQYKHLDITAYLLDKHDMLVQNMPTSEVQGRDIRLSQEIIMYQQRGLTAVLRTIIYIINTLTSNGVVWGVGRGSSVSSYVLYVLGVHDVDSYAYDLDINDFLHE